MVKPLNSYALLDKVIRISNSSVEIDRRLTNLLALFQREMGVDRAWLFNLDRDEHVLTLRRLGAETEPANPVRLSLNDNLIGRAALQRNRVLAATNELGLLPPDVAPLFDGFASVAAFPVMDDQVLYGVLALLHRDVGEYGPDRIALIETVCREMAGTIRNSRLYVESKKRIAELSVLYEVGKSVGSTLDLNHVLDTVVSMTAKVLKAGGCSLNVLDEASGALLLSAEFGDFPEKCRFKSRLASSDPASSEEVLACVTRDKAYVGPAARDPICYGMRTEGGDKSVIWMPLRFKGHYKGVLCVYDKIDAPPGRSRVFEREDMELLNTMAAMISSSLENGLTFQTVDQLARHNEALVQSLSCLYEISGAMLTTVKMDEVLTVIANALTTTRGLGFDRALVLLLDEDQNQLRGAARAEAGGVRSGDADEHLADVLRRKVHLNSALESRLDDFLALRLPLNGGRCILVRTVKEKRAFNVVSGNGDYHLNESLPPDFGRYAFATAPMLAKGKAVGVIAVDRDFRRTEISDEDVRNLSMLANQAGLAIENSRLYEYIEHANTELSQTRERLLEAEKLAALGEMAAGMAHEIRNPLVSIGGFTRRVLKQISQDSPLRFYIEVIIDEVTRLEKTLSEVLDFSRDTMGQLTEHNLNDVLSESLYVLRRDIEECGIELIKEFDETIPVVVIDERQIKHVFFNLFFNACQAMEHGGSLALRTYVTQEEDRQFVACEFSDTGPGIPANVLPNIFNPFFTTKDKGTGLGLSIVHKIVTRHGGQIDVVNRAEHGATFIVKLPVPAESGLYLR